MRKNIILFVILLTAMFVKSQTESYNNSVFYKAGIGAVVIDNEGFVFSNELSIPLFKGFEIAPSFSYCSTLPFGYSFASYSDLESSTDPVILIPSPQNVSYYHEYSIYSFDAHIYFRPFDFLKSPILKNHILKIGGGLGFKHITNLAMETSSNIPNLIYLSQHIDSGIEANAAIQYNYIIKNKYMVGCDFVVAGYDGATFLRFLLGVKL